MDIEQILEDLEELAAFELNSFELILRVVIIQLSGFSIKDKFEFSTFCLELTALPN